MAGRRRSSSGSPELAVEARLLAVRRLTLAAGHDGAGEGREREAQAAGLGADLQLVVAEAAPRKQRAAGAAPQQAGLAAAAAVGGALPAGAVRLRSPCQPARAAG
jgi:hypothetical protein